MEELIIFTAPYEDGEPDSEPVVVSRNGVTYTIMRGVPTKIPRGVADILENAYKIRNLTPHLPVGGGFDCTGWEGIIPHIGANGNWWIGDVDTGKPSRGEDYVLTETDQSEIAALVLAQIPDGDEVSYG